MIELIFDSIFSQMAEWTGSYALVCLGFMAFIVGILVVFGLDFDFSLLMSTPLPYAFYKSGYIEAWVSGVMIVFVVGISIYMIWIKFQNKY
jgi:hypothetical protein